MTARTVLGFAAALLLTATTTARADGPVPQAFRGLKPHRVVQQIMAQKEVLQLTDEQFARLDDLSIAIRTEKHSFIHQGGAPHNTQHVPMVTRRSAYEEALAILTPDQPARLEALFLAATAVATLTTTTLTFGQPMMAGMEHDSTHHPVDR